MAVTGKARSASGQFWSIWVAEGCSVLGDQLAKVAVTLVVYRETGSAAWSGLAYALMLLPPLITGPMLAPLADRFDRRTVMIICCALQGILIAIIAIPGMGVAGTSIAVALVSVLATPFKAAQGALVLDVLGERGNMTGDSWLMTVREAGQLLGLAGAAAVVAIAGVTSALLLDVASFLIASTVLGLGLPARPAPPRPRRREASALRLIVGDRALRPLAGLVLVSSLTMVPDGVIAPLVAEARAPSWTVGVLLGADSLGMMIGTVWTMRRPVQQKASLIAPMALLSLAPLVIFFTAPAPLIIAALLVFSGVGAAFLPLAAGQVTQRAPRHRAAAVRGLVSTGLRAGQGLAALAGGLLAQYLRSASTAIAFAGLVGVSRSVWFAITWQRNSRPQVALR